MKFDIDLKQLSFNIAVSIPKEHDKLFMDKETRLIGRLPNIKSNFMGSDNPLSFEENRKKYGVDWKYHDSYETLTYNYNRFGHRTEIDPFNPPDIWGLTVGCSMTEGQGLHTEDLWHQKLGIPVYNAGVGGAGNDLSFHNMHRMIRIARPTYIFFQLPFSHRYFFIKEDHIKIVGMWDVVSPITNHKDSVKESIETNYDWSRTRIIVDAAQTLADLAGSKIIFVDAYSELNVDHADHINHPASRFRKNTNKFPPLSDINIVYEDMGTFDHNLDYDLARDCFHPGSTIHDRVADKVKALM